MYTLCLSPIPFSEVDNKDVYTEDHESPEQALHIARMYTDSSYWIIHKHSKPVACDYHTGLENSSIVMQTIKT